MRYRGHEGQPLISVTQVLAAAGRIDDTWFTEASAWRGQEVHRLTEVFDSTGQMEPVEPHLMGYLEAYAAFVATVRPRMIATEVVAVDHDLGVGGRIDRVVDIYGARGILDIKTSAPSSWHGQQLAAYNCLRPEGCRWGLYLQANGRYKLKPYDDPHDYRRFLADLQTARRVVRFDEYPVTVVDPAGGKRRW